MARTTKEELQRYAGAQWFDELIRKDGIDKAREQLEWRIDFGVPLQVKKSDLDECVQRIKKNTINTMLLMGLLVLADEFDFDKAKLEAFQSRFVSKVDCLDYELAKWSDYQQILEDEYGITVALSGDIVGSRERG